VPDADSARMLDLLRRDAVQVYATYEALLNDRGDGTPVDADRPQLARELARMDLTLNYYTQWYWKIDLHNLLHFLSLRSDDHAQLEIRAYADAIAAIVAEWVPHAWEAFEDYRSGARLLSREELELTRRIIKGEDPDEILPKSGLSLRERKDLRTILGLGPPKRSV
jgi:thymidylate synthase (FAD)